jgi:hypothetical protein
MPTRKPKPPAPWVTSHQANVITRLPPRMVRRLVLLGKVRVRRYEGFRPLYSREDLEALAPKTDGPATTSTPTNGATLPPAEDDLYHGDAAVVGGMLEV